MTDVSISIVTTGVVPISIVTTGVTGKPTSTATTGVVRGSAEARWLCVYVSRKYNTVQLRPQPGCFVRQYPEPQ